MIKMKKLCFLILFIFINPLTFAHHSWIKPDSGPIKAGTKAVILITQGHSFPSGGHSLPVGKTKAFAIDPANKKTQLALKDLKSMLAADYKPVMNGVHRFFYIYDTGVMSKTTKGWKDGGKDLHPDALLCRKVIHTGVAYTRTPGSEWRIMEGANLPFEILPEIKKEKIILTLLLDSKVVSGVDVKIQTDGSKEKDIGKTDGHGKIEYSLPASLKKEILFIASLKNEAVSGDPSFSEILSTSAYIDLR